MEPLLDITKHYNLNCRIVDNLAREHKESNVDVQDLISAIDEMQLKVKENMFSLLAIQKEIDQEVQDSSLLQDALNLRKTTLVGCKMKIY